MGLGSSFFRTLTSRWCGHWPIAALDGRSAILCDAMELFREMSEQVPGLNHDELVLAADQAKQIGRELRGLAWRLEQVAKRAEAQKRGS
jgi:hypothetical protein